MKKGTLLRIIHSKDFNPVDFDNKLRDLTHEDETEWYIEDVWMREIHDKVIDEGFEDWYYADLYISYKDNVIPHANLILSYVKRMKLSNVVVKEIADAYV